MKKWRKLTTLGELPRNKTFLLFDENFESGIGVYEAMMFDSGTMGCPATTEDYKIEDFSHWRPMIKLPKKKEGK